MTDESFKFICLEAKKKKRLAIWSSLSGLGLVCWHKFCPLQFKNYPETYDRAHQAYDTSTKKPKSYFLKRLKITLLSMQYNGSRAFFEKNSYSVAVVWNGLNGTRKAFMDGARDAGARTLFFELSPFPGRITVDPKGVNFDNSLPREIGPYLSWAKKTNNFDSWSKVTAQIKQRQSKKPLLSVEQKDLLDQPFCFLPLQVPGDSQLRLFGGEFKTVEAVIEAAANGARALPDGWHVRIKEHPSACRSFKDLIDKHSHPKLVLDNTTDTFKQVRLSRAVVTVNSSVGLEAMFFEKPVIVLGQCFWSIPHVAIKCENRKSLEHLLKTPEQLSFDIKERGAFLSFLTEIYYPKIAACGAAMLTEETIKIRRRLVSGGQFNGWFS